MSDPFMKVPRFGRGPGERRFKGREASTNYPLVLQRTDVCYRTDLSLKLEGYALHAVSYEQLPP